MQILYEYKQVNDTYNTKFLGLIIDRSMCWGVCIEELSSKLNKAFYGIRLIKPFMSLEVLRFTNSQFNSISKGRYLFWN